MNININNDEKLFKYDGIILGARHTVYYTRIGQEATLLIDRIEVPLEKLPPQDLWEVFDVGSNEVQIGGLNTTDRRLKIYKGYNGCLSSKNTIVLLLAMIIIISIIVISQLMTTAGRRLPRRTQWKGF